MALDLAKINKEVDDLKKKVLGGKPKTEKLNTKAISVNVKPIRGKNGGARAGAGRKANVDNLIVRGIKEQIDEYARGEEEIEIQDPRTGMRIKVKKPRIFWALETFFKYGMALSTKNEFAGIQALDKFLDRTLGKPAQPIRGEGDDDPPIKLDVDIKGLLAKAYGNDPDTAG